MRRPRGLGTQSCDKLAKAPLSAERFRSRIPKAPVHAAYIHVPVADPNSKLPPVEEILLDPKETLHLRSRGRDFPFELVASDTLETKDLIVAMGVSLVIGAAAQRSFDRCVE